ncbi:MAG: aldo/keto reductase, partial [Planctomycetota bacterium]
MTTVGVTDVDRRATLQAAIDAGIRRFDTAFSYGRDGQSDRWLGQYLPSIRDEAFVVGKVGQRYEPSGKRVADGSPKTLIRDAETSLSRLGLDRFDLLMLHQIDPSVAPEQSMAALLALQDRGLTKQIGVCNVDLPLLRELAANFPIAAIQCPLNLLQPDRLGMIQWCAGHGIQTHVFWTLMKGLLAGSIRRNHVFADGDSRPGYDIFQGTAFERAQRLIDELDALAKSSRRTISQLSIGWAMSQPGVTAPLVGARRPAQVQEIAAASQLNADVLEQIERIVRETER